MNGKDVEKLPTIKLVYMGYRFVDGKHQHIWLLVNDQDGDLSISPSQISGRWVLSKHKNMVSASPGMIYKFPTKDGGKTIYPGHATYVDRWGDKTAVIQWEADHQANKLAHLETGKAAKAQKESMGFEALLPFREAYTSLTPAKRAMMLAWVIRYITRQ